MTLTESSDRMIAELDSLVGELFKGERRKITVLQTKIERRRRNHESTTVLQRELCELMARQIRREIA